MSEGSNFSSGLSRINSLLVNTSCTCPDDYTRLRESIRKVTGIVDSEITKETTSLEEFEQFLKSSYNLCVRDNALVRSALFRIVRVIIQNIEEDAVVLAYVNVIEKLNWHWLVSISFEREPILEQGTDDFRRGIEDEEMVKQDFVFERMQALKVIKVIMNRCKTYIPIALVRSVVAVAGNAKDNLRRVSLEILRHMCVTHSSAVLYTKGIDALLAAMYDPSFIGMVPSITSSFIFMLNHQKTRQLMHPFVTLRSFVAPFTDVDTTESEMRHRWNASKCALVVILRSWSGIACLAEDPIGLPSIVGLLRDTSAPDALKDSILDAFLEVFEPIFSRVKRARGPSRKEDQYYRTLTIATTAKGYSTGRVSSSRKSGPEESTSTTSNKAGNPSMIGMAVGSGSARVLESSKNAASISKLSGNTQTDARQNEISRQSSSESSKSSKSTSGWISSIFGRSTPENTSESDKATNGSKRRQLGSFTELNKNSLIPDRDSPTTKKKRSITKSIAFDVPDSFTNVSKTKYVEHVLYNVLDNYAGLLCVALLHSDILQGLIHLGTRSNLVLAGKARWFFVEFIRVVGHVLPESTCSALLEMPSLIQVTSTNFFGHSSINRKFNAVQLLESFADAFTLAPRSYNSAQPISKSSKISDVVSVLPRNSGQGSPSFSFSGGSTDGNNHYSMFSRIGILGEGVGVDNSISIHAVVEYIAPQSAKKIRKNSEALHQINGSDIIPANPYDNGDEQSDQKIRETAADILADINDSDSDDELNAASDKSQIESKDNTENVRNNQNFYKVSGNAGDNDLDDEDPLQRILQIRKRIKLKDSSFDGLVEATKVNGKEGKEPFRWSWSSIFTLFAEEFQDVVKPHSHDSVGYDSRALAKNKHLDELMNTKFIRRLCGFYRCSTEEKGYFANLTWEPSNFNYYECAVMLYQRLVNDENGHKFLNSDRRGMVFVEIAAELKNLINIFDKSIPSSSFFSVGKRENAGESLKNNDLALRKNAVQYTLSRGYFDLIGVVLKTSGGQKIIDNTDIFGNLCEIGSYPQLDYLSRVAITSLVFSDYGTMSSHIIRHWTSGIESDASGAATPKRYSTYSTMPGSTMEQEHSGRRRTASINSSQPVVGRGRGRCSIGLKNYIYNLLGCLLHTRSDEFQEWGIEITVHMMTWETPGNVSRHLTRLLLLVVQKVENLLLFIEKLESVPKRKLDITIDSSYAEILPYFLSVPQGVKYCQSGIGNPIRDGSYLDQIIEDFTVDGEGDTFEKYSRSYERILSKALSPSYVKNILSPSQNIKPIPYLTRDFCSTYSNGTLIPENGIHQSDLIYEARDSFSSEAYRDSEEMESPKIGNANSGSRSKFSIAYGPNAGVEVGGTFKHPSLRTMQSTVRETEQIDIEGLLKLPWNIEVKSYKPTDDTVPAGSPEGEYIPVDCFLDPSDLAMPSVSDISTDYNRFVKVRGMVLDDFGMPSGRVIKNERSVASTLMIGLCPVTSDGSMKTSVFQEGSNGENVLSFEQAKRSVTAQLSGTQHPEMNGVRSGDYPPTYLLENLYDWTSCKPYTGKFGVEVFTEIDENYFSIEIPNQPCKFIFSRSKPVTSFAADAVSGGVQAPPKRNSFVSMLGGSRPSVARNISDESSSNMLYLVEVQYYISVYTGQGHFAKLPCHPLSMLCRTDEGASLLEEKRVIQNLLCFVTEHNPDQDHSVNKLKAVLWNLAHIASSDAGFSAIVSESRVVVAKNPLLNKFSLIEWCIENATTHPNLSLCGTLFSILGLISRSTRGRMILNKFHWSCSSPGSSSAVAIPKYSGDLFKLQTTDPVRSKKTVTELLKEAVASKEKIQTPPELTSKEQEILSLVSKLNGATYDSGHQHLERMKNESPADFSSHSLYVGVMDLFEQHSFSLSDRRFVLSLLPDEARLET